MEPQNDSQNMPRQSPSKTSSKMAYFKSRNGKCQRPGPVGRNPYLNFLREFRKRNCGLSAVETIKRGAKEWKTLPKEKKLQYIEAAKANRANSRRQNMLPEDNMSEEEDNMCEESEEEEEEAFLREKTKKKEKKQMWKTESETSEVGSQEETPWMQETKETKRLQMLATGWICRL